MYRTPPPGAAPPSGAVAVRIRATIPRTFCRTFSSASTPRCAPAWCRWSRAPGCCGSSTTRAWTSCAARGPGRSGTSSSTACRRSPAQLPDELARRAEARALLGDIHRLPERQRSVLVMSAIEGLSHEEVAGRLDDHRRDHPLAARPCAREPAPHRGGARDRLPRRLRCARRGRRGGRAGERDRAPPLWTLHGLPRVPARAARGALAAAPAREPGARGDWSRSWSAAAGGERAEGRGRRLLRARGRRRSGRGARDRGPHPPRPGDRGRRCRVPVASRSRATHPRLERQRRADGRARRTDARTDLRVGAGHPRWRRSAKAPKAKAPRAPGRQCRADARRDCAG